MTDGFVTSAANMLERTRFGVRPDSQHGRFIDHCIWILSEPLQLANFVYRPQLDRDDIPVLLRISRMLFWLLLLFACNTVYFELLGDPILRPEMVAGAENQSYLKICVITCLLVPVCEELIFRAGLRNPYYLFFWGVPIVGILYYFSFDRSPIPVALVAVYFAWIAMRLNTNRKTNLRQFANERFENAYGSALWGYTLAFGFSHVANFTDRVTVHNVLYILPHTMIGLVLAYLRIRDGLWFAILLHGSINFLYLKWEMAF